MAGSTSFQSALPASMRRQSCGSERGRASASSKRPPLKRSSFSRRTGEKPPSRIVCQRDSASGANLSAAPAGSPAGR